MESQSRSKSSSRNRTSYRNSSKQVQKSKITQYLQRTPTKPNSKPAKTTKVQSPSYEKYGIELPSYEKILADHKKFDECKAKLKKLDDFDDNLLKKFKPKKVEDKPNIEVMNCEHLTIEELNAVFDKHSVTLERIMKGDKYSQRHEIFHNYHQSHPANSGLKCSPSFLVFNEKQRLHLLDLLDKKFDKENNLAMYFLKVLLPELCLLIFMDVHSMSARKAKKYLNEYPLN